MSVLAGRHACPRSGILLLSPLLFLLLLLLLLCHCCCCCPAACLGAGWPSTAANHPPVSPRCCCSTAGLRSGTPAHTMDTTTANKTKHPRHKVSGRCHCWLLLPAAHQQVQQRLSTPLLAASCTSGPTPQVVRYQALQHASAAACFWTLLLCPDSCCQYILWLLLSCLHPPTASSTPWHVPGQTACTAIPSLGCPCPGWSDPGCHPVAHRQQQQEGEGREVQQHAGGCRRQKQAQGHNSSNLK
jgi:hypothetical protein